MTEDDMLMMKMAQQETEPKAKKDEFEFEIEMSTEGNLYAPAVVHIRNFSTSEMLDLGLAAQEDLYKKVVELLRSISDIPVPEELSERELDEILMKLYFHYYGEKISIPYMVSEDDTTYQKIHLSPELFKKWQASVQNDPPTIDYSEDSIDFAKNPSKKYKVRVSTGPHKIVYKVLRIRDIFMLQEFLDKKYPKDPKLEAIGKAIKDRDEEIKLTGKSDITVPSEAEENYKSYINRAVVDQVKYTEYLAIDAVDDTDLSSMDMLEKFNWLDEARVLSVKSFNTASYALLKIPYGPIIKGPFKSPITGEEIDDYYPFRLDAVVSAYSRIGSSRYDYDLV